MFLSNQRANLFITTTFALIIGAPANLNAKDSSSDAPLGFGQVVPSAKGVLLRVPINKRGEEDTDNATLRFYNGPTPVTASSPVNELWQRSRELKDSPELLGQRGPVQDPRRDSSTWGWYNWCNRGWMYPYYYITFYPTFYYDASWYYFTYFTYWNWWGYRYYYYTWWY